MKIFSIDNSSSEIYKIIKVFGINFKYRKTGYSYIFKNKIYDFIFWLNRKSIKHPYKIIPMGTSCFARVLTTYNKLKPTREQGEKTCPFDLIAINDFEVVLDLLDSDFEGFCDDIYYQIDEKQKTHWMNDRLSIDFCHDGELLKEDVEKRYDERIKNMYEYFQDKTIYKHILIATPCQVRESQIERLFSILYRFMDKSEFDVILVNQSGSKNVYQREHFYVINHDKYTKEYEILVSGGSWVGDFKSRRRPEAQKIYNDFTFEMIKILKNNN